MKKMSDARNDLLKCVELKSDYTAGIKGLAETSFHLGYCRQAAEHYNKLIQIKAASSKPAEKEIADFTEKRRKAGECASYIERSDQLKTQNEVKGERDHLNAALDMLDYPHWGLLERKAQLNYQNGDYYEVVADMGAIIKKVSERAKRLNQLHAAGAAVPQMALSNNLCSEANDIGAGRQQRKRVRDQRAGLLQARRARRGCPALQRRPENGPRA